jgi:acyl-CoA-binding protein
VATSDRARVRTRAASAFPVPLSDGSIAFREEERMAAPKDLKAAFQAATAAAKQTKKKPDNATLLKLYSYYKQASEGDVSGNRPGGFDFVGGAKFDAWSKLKGMSKDEAMQNYIKQVEKLNRE